MITSPRERGDEGKQESNKSDSKLSKPTSSSRQWAGFRNPRIVRVSRSFGGKDRHSKVCTIRGLRDRRIRLSVPTAIQLYDLQDRLGLGQPSKVIDWLLDATKHDIDKLPPLQLPQGFGQFHQDPLSASQSSLPPFFDSNFTFSKDGGAHSLGININENVEHEKSRFWDMDTALRGKSKVDRGTISDNSQVSAQNFFPSLPGSYYNWEPSNLSLSHFGGHGFVSQTENPPSGSQLFFSPSTPLFPPYPPHVNAPVESDPRQMNNIQLFSSSSQHMLPTSLMPSTHSISLPLKSSLSKFNAELLHSQNHNEHQPDKDETGS